MEEEINKKVYCHGRENKDGKIVKKMCGCFLHREDDWAYKKAHRIG